MISYSLFIQISTFLFSHAVATMLLFSCYVTTLSFLSNSPYFHVSTPYSKLLLLPAFAFLCPSFASFYLCNARRSPFRFYLLSFIVTVSIFCMSVSSCSFCLPSALSFSLHPFFYHNLVSNLSPFNYSLSPFFTYLRVLIPHLLYVFDLFPSGHSRHNRSLILFSLFFTYLFSPIFPFIFYTSLSTNSCFPTILYLSSYLIFLNSHIFLLPYTSPTICIHAT